MNATVSTPRFGVFCFASFLLSMSYGVTFLLTLLVTSFGGNERDAGQVFAVAMLSTLAAVLGSGHLMQRLGASRAIAIGTVFLVLASLGFASAPGVGVWLMACGFLLGVGWGVFYTLGPIMVADSVEPARRTHCFALLSGSMLTGIGTGPLLGKLTGYLGVSVQQAFLCAAIAAALGGLYFWRRGARWQGSKPREQISLGSSATVLRSPSAWSILMVGLGGAIFGGLGSFQTTYAADHGLDYSLFFIGFMGAAIGCRLLIAGWVVKRNPFAASCVLTSLMLVAVFGFGEWVEGSVSYVLTAALLGIGYGLNYSVINGLAANEAPSGTTAQALLLFSLAYFIGVFGFPFLAGRLISHTGVYGMWVSTVLIALLVWGVSTGRYIRWQWAKKG
ncbi:MFS transporter [Pseudomonas sp. dw_358]|uniref:MFS transporter n=1 Tax=Pseudomonas sp. dw_358 TaxID=2720083 RepID=UPI001BD4B01E|nr:MFS transporter [Pseudomonas sp. dw_358]